jgi:hypothetical protein
VACCTSTYIFVDSCYSITTTFSSLASFCTIYASTKCCSTSSSSSDSLMNIGSIDVAPGLVCFLTCQCRLLLHKNSIIDVSIVSILNYRLCKLYLLIICLPFYTFWKWWWMQWRLHIQWLNIQHTFSHYSSQLLFYFCSFQQFYFLFLPLFMLTLLRFPFPCYFM